MGSSQQFSLRWNNYLSHITEAFDSLRTDEDFVDCTLSCEGKKIKAHKILLSACSPYFREIFKENPCKHPVVVLRNVGFNELEALVTFMYQGEVNVDQDNLQSFLNTAEFLEIQGLSGRSWDSGPEDDVIEDDVSNDESQPGVDKIASSINQSTPIIKKRKSPESPNNSIFDPNKSIKAEHDYFDSESTVAFDEPNYVDDSHDVTLDQDNGQTNNLHNATGIADSNRASNAGTSNDTVGHDPLQGSAAHPKSRPNFWCEICQVSFTFPGALERHNFSKHSTGVPSYCQLCSKFFKTKWSLATHNSKYHKDCIKQDS